MDLKYQKGFSLIELLMVVVILGILAGITAPFLIKAKNKAENGNAFSTTRSIFSSQVSFYTSKGRYARLDELNADSQNGLGNIVNSRLVRGPFTFEMNPANPTDAELKDGFSIFVTKQGASGIDAYTLLVDTSGRIIENPPE